MYQEITLTDYERFHVAPIWAHRRWMEALQRGYPDKHGFDGDGLGAHFWGICGEMAFAKALNIYFTPTCNTFKKPDVLKVQVRTRTKHSYELIVRQDDKDSEVFVLVTVEPTTAWKFHVHGGILACEAKQHSEWKKEYAGRESAWFIPAEALKPLEEIKKELHDGN